MKYKPPKIICSYRGRSHSFEEASNSLKPSEGILFINYKRYHKEYEDSYDGRFEIRLNMKLFFATSSLEKLKIELDLLGMKLGSSSAIVYPYIRIYKLIKKDN